MLLPVTVLLRRADAAKVIWAALVARAGGQGHRTIAALVGVPASTVRGWLRRMSTRLESVRVHFTGAARRAGVDQAAPDATGSGRGRRGARDGAGAGDQDGRMTFRSLYSHGFARVAAAEDALERPGPGRPRG